MVSYPSSQQIQLAGAHCFTYDYLYSETSTQAEVYGTCVAPLVHSFFEGYNGEGLGQRRLGLRLWLGVRLNAELLLLSPSHVAHLILLCVCFHSLCMRPTATILAYGQTGSGKTHTMGTASSSGMQQEQFGIIPRVINELFELIKKRERTHTYVLSLSFLEIYKSVSLRVLLWDECARDRDRDQGCGALLAHCGLCSPTPI